MAPPKPVDDEGGAAACLRLPDGGGVDTAVYAGTVVPTKGDGSGRRTRGPGWQQPKPEDSAAGRGSGWKADVRNGVKIYPEKMTGLVEGRVIINDVAGTDAQFMSSIYRQGYQKGVEALPGLKGVPIAGKGLKGPEEQDQRGDVGGPLVWDRSTALRAGAIGSIYQKSYLGSQSARGAAEEANRGAGKTATEDDLTANTRRCVELITTDDWKRLVRSEYQVANDEEKLQRSHRSRQIAKGMTSDEREERWLKCFAQSMQADEEADKATTATSAGTGLTKMTDFSIMPSGFQSKKSEEIRARNQSYGRVRLHMYDEMGKDPQKKGGPPYATPIAEDQQVKTSVYGKDFVAHIGKAPGRKRKTRQSTK